VVHTTTTYYPAGGTLQLVVVVAAGLWVWLALAMWRRSRFARITLTVLGILGDIVVLIEVIGQANAAVSAADGVSIAVNIVELLLVGVAVTLLWQAQSFAYFFKPPGY
jgi:hypothetical protein